MLNRSNDQPTENHWAESVQNYRLSSVESGIKGLKETLNKMKSNIENILDLATANQNVEAENNGFQLQRISELQRSLEVFNRPLSVVVQVRTRTNLEAVGGFISSLLTRPNENSVNEFRQDARNTDALYEIDALEERVNHLTSALNNYVPALGADPYLVQFIKNTVQAINSVQPQNSVSLLSTAGNFLDAFLRLCCMNRF